jgi:hypothetical protein
MRAVLAAALLLAVPATAAAGAAAPAQDPAYEAANARLSRSTPHYPRATLLTAEPVWGDAGSGEFEAIQRVYSLARSQSQRAVTAFYASKLGRNWQRRGAACHGSGSRLVVALLHRNGRRLGVLIDSRGAELCRDERTLLTNLLNVGQ